MSFIIDDANTRKKVDIEIIAGDLNTFKYFNMPNWNSIREITKEAGFTDLTSEIAWTFSDYRFTTSYFAKHKLDAIFIRYSHAEFTSTSWSLDIAGSDHIPVFANITLA
jgi:endonuclease/exonuclease/phosphatase family metal-dependent hydrolase